MKQFKLLILLLVIGFVGEAQINYLPIKSRYKLIAGLFDSTLHIPSGTTPGLRTGGYDYRGALFYKTSDSTVYVYTGTQWISVKGSGGSGSADSTIFATLYRLDTAKINLRTLIAAKLAIADTANNWVTSLYRKAGTDSVFYTKGSSHTFAFKDSIGAGGGGGTPAGNYGNVQLNRNGALATPASDSLDFDAGLNIKGALTATALPTGGVAADSLVVVTSAGALKKRNAGDFPSGSGVDLRVGLWNGTSTLTSHQRYTYTNSNDYPSLIIGAGTGATYGASIQLRDVAGTYSSITTDGGPQSYYGSSTYRSHNFYDYVGGAGLIARFYSGTGTRYAELQGLVIASSLSVPSNEQGAVTISRTVPYAATGNNYHGYTDQTIWRLGNEAFNSFGSFVKMGNNRTDFNHYAAFQSVWQKDSTNKVGKIYDFVSATSTMTGGTVDTLSRFEVFEVSKSGGTIVRQYGIKIPSLTAATTNVGAWIYNNVGIGPTAHTPTEKLYVDGNIWNTGTVKTGDPGSGAGAWKLGTAITTSGLVLNTTTYVEITIGGTTYRLAVVDPPQP